MAKHKDVSNKRLKQMEWLFKVSACHLISLYRLWGSPFIGPHCRFLPSCSEFAAQAIQTHGLLKGGRLALLRLVRCHPFHSGGADPVKP